MFHLRLTRGIATDVATRDFVRSAEALGERRHRILFTELLPTMTGVAALLVGATTVFAQMQLSLNSIWGVAAKPDRSSILILVKNRVLSLAIVCASGLTVVGIDNGFGAACAVLRLLGVLDRTDHERVDAGA